MGSKILISVSAEGYAKVSYEHLKLVEGLIQKALKDFSDTQDENGNFFDFKKLEVKVAKAPTLVEMKEELLDWASGQEDLDWIEDATDEEVENNITILLKQGENDREKI